MSDFEVTTSGTDDGRYDKWVTTDKTTGKVHEIMQCWSNYGATNFTRIWDVQTYYRDGTTSSYHCTQFPCPKCKGSIRVYDHCSVLGPHIDQQKCKEVGCSYTHVL